MVGGTNYYKDPPPPGSELFDNIYYCIAPPCLEKNMSATDTGNAMIARDITIFMDAFDGIDGSGVPDAGDSWIASTSNPGTLTYASQKYANSCIPGQSTSSFFSTCDEPVWMEGPHIRQWINNWVALTNFLSHSSFMSALAYTARTQEDYSWCDVCRLFAIHTPGNEATPQDLGLTTPVPIAQYSGACLSSPIKDWIGPPPDPSLTDLDRVCNPQPYVCEVCLAGSIAGPDGCICGPHQIPNGFNCSQCPADEIAVLVGTTWHCYTCGPGVPIDGQNACQCNPTATQAPDGTCTSICSRHAVLQGGQCVDCGPSASYPDPTDTVCLSCPPSAPYCDPAPDDGLCYGNCLASCCAKGWANPQPGSMLCGGCDQACGCIP